MENNITLENIQDVFFDIRNKPNSNFNLYRIYSAYQRECDTDQRKQEISQLYKYVGYHNEVNIVNDEIAIVTHIKNGKVLGYFAHVGNRKSNVLWDDYYKALLAAISIKMTGEEDATEWMWRLIV